MMCDYETKDYHANLDNLVSVNKLKRVRGLSKLKKVDNVLCKQCQLGKMTKPSFKSNTHTSKGILDLVHIDLCGPINMQSYKGDKHIILFDDYSRMMTIIFLNKKFNAFQMFKWFLARVKRKQVKASNV